MSVLLHYRDSSLALYNAQDHLQIQSDFLTDGLANYLGDLGDFKVEANSPLAMNVLIDSGRCYMGVTVSGEYRRERIFANAQHTFNMTAESSGNDRIDALIIRNDVDAMPDAEKDNVATYAVVQGTPAGSPVAPTDEEIATEIGSDGFKRIANITIRDGAATIDPSDISDTRTDSFMHLHKLHYLLESGYWIRGRKFNDNSILNIARMVESGSSNFLQFETSIPRIIPSLHPPTQDYELVPKKYVDDAASGPPAGGLMPFAGAEGDVPDGWLLCDGSAVSQSTYSALYTVIGTTYGNPGGGNFNLPDLRGRFILGIDNMGGSSANRVTATEADTLGGAEGSESHQLTTSEMPSHTHRMYDDGTTDQGTSGPGSNDRLNYDSVTSSGDSASGYAQNTGSQGSNGAHNNMPPYIALNYIIKT